MTTQTKVCKKCGAERPSDVRKCKPCSAAYSRDYRARHPEKTHADLQSWRESNKEHLREYARQYRDEHLDRAREVQRNKYHRNADRINRTLRERYRYNINGRRDKARKYRAAHAERERARMSNWRAANIEQALERERAERERNKKRRSLYMRLRNVFDRERLRDIERESRMRNPMSHRISEQTRRARKAAVGGAYTASEWHALCDWFGNVCLCCGADGKLTADHAIPLALMGPNDIANIQPLCGPCNSRKRDRTIDYRDPGLLAAFLSQMEAPK